MEERKRMREKKENGEELAVKALTKVEATSTPDRSLSSKNGQSRTMSFFKLSQRSVDIDPGSLAVRAPPTTSDVMKATRPPLILSPEVGVIPPHKQVNVKVSFFPERLEGMWVVLVGGILGWCWVVVMLFWFETRIWMEVRDGGIIYYAENVKFHAFIFFFFNSRAGTFREHVNYKIEGFPIPLKMVVE
jgi:hypothetical protein